MTINWNNPYGIFEAWLDEKGLRDEFCNGGRCYEIIDMYDKDEEFESRIPPVPKVYLPDESELPF